MIKRVFAALAVLLVVGVVAQAQVVSTLSTEPFAASGGVAVDTEGNIYVADYGLRLNLANGTTVYKFTPEGERSIFVTGMQGASGNGFDSHGNLYQSNIAGNRVSKITPDGQVSVFATQGIQGPVGVAVDHTDDTVFVANCGAQSIQKITQDGTSTRLVTSQLLQCANGLTIDDEGNLYTATFNTGNVVKVTQEGVASLLARIPGGNNGHLTFANGILYVVGRGANQIYEVTLEGQITLLAGTSARGNADGPALEATFSVPNGIAVSPDGRFLYINDAVPVNGANLNPVVLRVIDLQPEEDAEAANVDSTAMLLAFLLIFPAAYRWRKQ
jgi:sugar lactone lactonase YvrE